MKEERPVVDMKEFLEQRRRDGKPLIVIEPETASGDRVEKLRSVMPDGQKDRIQYVNLDADKPKCLEFFENERT